MKKLIFCLTLAAIFAACNNSQPTDKKDDKKETVPAKDGDGIHFGTVINAEGSQPITAALAAMKDKKEMDVKVEGKVTEVCQKMGCWVKVAADGKDPVMVMTGEKFFFPKDIVGKTLIISGKATLDTTTVDMLRHLAEDAGKSKDEIAAIKTPKVEVVVNATGAMLKQ